MFPQAGTPEPKDPSIINVADNNLYQLPKYGRPTNQFNEVLDEESIRIKEDQKKELLSDLEIQILEKKKRKEEERLKQINEERRFNEKVERDRI